MPRNIQRVSNLIDKQKKGINYLAHLDSASTLLNFTSWVLLCVAILAGIIGVSDLPNLTPWLVVFSCIGSLFILKLIQFKVDKLTKKIQDKLDKIDDLLDL